MTRPSHELPASALHVWCCDTRGLPLEQWEARAAGTLQQSEWEALPTLAPPAVRVSSLAGRLALRRLLSRYAAVAPADWRFERAGHGRPFVSGPSLREPLHFSVSHTQGLVAVAVGRFPDFGVDVEREDRALRAEGLAERYCAPEERRELDALAPDERSTRLLRFWTLKEAFAKARGSGLRFPLRKADFSGALETGPVQARLDPSLGETLPWRFHTLRWIGEYRLSLAWRGEAAVAPRVRALAAQELDYP